ncbi:MAG TPA: LppP/LprE family lipoprotein, partial [Methylomirabilota bacterium]|nr:LppP/LprE family lipoprotein [Methylomirabilota bacterium]
MASEHSALCSVVPPGMLCFVLSVIMALSLLVVTPAAAAPTASWLDEERPVNWNKMRAPVPEGPAADGDPADTPRCKDQVRAPDTSMDRTVTSRGWSLIGPTTTHGATIIIVANTSVDGMCRPRLYQAFVFVKGRFAGTLSPVAMNAREDGAENMIRVVSAYELTVQYARYADADP